MLKQVKSLINNQICICIIKIYPSGLIKQLMKLVKYYELIVFTILPRDIINQIYKLCPGITDLISHTLCNEELVYTSDMAYKDLSLLTKNRMTHLIPEDGEEDTE